MKKIMKQKKSLKKAGKGVQNRDTTQIKRQNSEKRKDKDFNATNIDKDTAKMGIDMESGAVKQRKKLYYIVIAAGVVLAIWGISDNGLVFEGLGFKFSGSSVGLMVIILGVVGMLRNKPKVTITNGKSDM